MRVWEESSTAASLDMLTQARSASGSLTDQVWRYVGGLVESSIAMPDGLRDYFVAYLRERDHVENQARLAEVVDAIRRLFPPDEHPAGGSAAQVGCLDNLAVPSRRSVSGWRPRRFRRRRHVG